MSRKAVIAGAALVIGLVAGVLVGGKLVGAEETVNFVLKPGSGGCEFALKQDAYVVTGNNLKFRFRNDCGNEVQVMMGNVRTEREGGSQDCQNANVRSTPWPFKDDDADPEKRSATVSGNGKGQFILHGARNAGEYYFDVCLGGKVVDPRLWVE